MPKGSLILNENNLLKDLNTIADFVVGNNPMEDYGYKDLNTLPESLAFAMMHPYDLHALHSARKKIRILSQKVTDIDNKLTILIKRIEIKRKI